MSSNLFEVIVINLDGSEFSTQMTLQQIADIFYSGGTVLQRHYTVTFTNPDGSTFVGNNLMLKSTAELVGLPFVLGPPFEDRPFIKGEDFPPPPEPIPPPPPPPGATIPDSPRMNDAILITQTTASLSWSVPFDGGSPITGYNIVVRETLETTSPDTIKTDIPPASSFAATGLKANTHYFAFVKAVNAIGPSTANLIGMKEFDTLLVDEPLPCSTIGDCPVFTEFITQSRGVFAIVNDRVVGEVLYIAVPEFTDTTARAIMQVKKLDNTVIALKENTINFTPTERDERIFFDESALGQSEVIVDLFVWDKDGVILSVGQTFNVKAGIMSL